MKNIKKSWRSVINYDYSSELYESTDSLVLVVPNQSISLKEILSRSNHSMLQEFRRSGRFDNEPDDRDLDLIMEKPIDLVDAHEIHDELYNLNKDIEEKNKKLKEKRKIKKAISPKIDKEEQSDDEKIEGDRGL